MHGYQLVRRVCYETGQSLAYIVGQGTLPRKYYRRTVEHVACVSCQRRIFREVYYFRKCHRHYILSQVTQFLSPAIGHYKLEFACLVWGPLNSSLIQNAMDSDTVCNVRFFLHLKIVIFSIFEHIDTLKKKSWSLNHAIIEALCYLII